MSSVMVLAAQRALALGALRVLERDVAPAVNVVHRDTCRWPQAKRGGYGQVDGGAGICNRAHRASA